MVAARLDGIRGAGASRDWMKGLDEGVEKKRELAEDCGPAARPGPEVALRAAPGPGP